MELMEVAVGNTSLISLISKSILTQELLLLTPSSGTGLVSPNEYFGLKARDAECPNVIWFGTDL